MLQMYFDKLINVGDPKSYFKKNQQVGRSEQTITIAPNELYRLLSYVTNKLDEVVRHTLCSLCSHPSLKLNALLRW